MIAQVIGAIFALGLAIYIFQDETDIKGSVKQFLIIQSILILITFILFQLLMKSKPDFYPSAVAEAPIPDLSLRQSCKELRKNTSFLLLTIQHAMTNGCFLAVGALMSNLLHPFGFSPSQIGQLGLVMTVFGVMSAVLMGVIVDRTAQYRRIHLTLMISIVITAWLSIYALWTGLAWFIVVSVTLMGICDVGIRPIAFSYGVELTFPMQPALINGIMVIAASTVAFILQTTVSLLTEERDSDVWLTDDELDLAKRKRALFAMILFSSFFLVSTFCAYFIKEDLKRVRYSKTK